ncbi:MAG: DUF2760 domain-containing protein [Polyangiales bacterium]
MVTFVNDPDPPHVPMSTRFWFAFACFFSVLFDQVFADRTYRVHQELLEKGATPSSPVLPAKNPAPTVAVPASSPERPETPAHAPPPHDGALQLMALLQREGRLIDFLQEDVTTFSDAEVGAAARIVHQGCHKALRDHLKLGPVREEMEGAKVMVEAGTPAAAVKLVGNVVGSAPFQGVLRHRGWRIDDLHLPTSMAGHDARIVAPAEVEL